VSAEEHSRLLDRLRNLTATALELVETRLELVAIETEQHARRLLVRGALLLGAALAFGFALLFIAALVLLSFWEDHRLLACALIGIFFLTAGLLLVGFERWLRHRRPRWFAATRAELADDAASLRRHGP